MKVKERKLLLDFLEFIVEEKREISSASYNSTIIAFWAKKSVVESDKKACKHVWLTAPDDPFKYCANCPKKERK